jgi:predicted NAD/FAD-binding protein
MMAFPMATFVRFCHNHGLLQVTDRPQWYTIKNGAKNYVEKLLAALDDVRLNEPVLAIRRGSAETAGVTVTTKAGSEAFDQVVLAAHSDENLAMLSDPSPEEIQHLGAIKYQKNHAVLHTDATLLPKAVSAWAAWNYQCLPRRDAGCDDVCVHYLLNLLQPTPFKRALIVSLNSIAAPRDETVLQEFEYSHPVFDQAAIGAQGAIAALQGTRSTWYAGAWTGFGFHEDGLRSGLTVAAAIDDLAPSARHSRRDDSQVMRAA